MSSAETTGWFTIGAAVGGIVLTGVGSYFASRAAHRRERARDLRQERLAAYADYLALFAVWKWRISAARGTSQDSHEVRELLGSMHDASALGGRINLLGGGEVRSAAAACLGAFSAAGLDALRGKPAAEDLDDIELNLVAAMRNELRAGSTDVPVSDAPGNTVVEHLRTRGYPPPTKAGQ